MGSRGSRPETTAASPQPSAEARPSTKSNPDDAPSQLSMSTLSSRLACQLGAVLGLQADCCRRMGDDGGLATALYAQSVEALTPFAAGDDEVSGRGGTPDVSHIFNGGVPDVLLILNACFRFHQVVHSLSVTNNKRGDLCYYQQVRFGLGLDVDLFENRPSMGHASSETCSPTTHTGGGAFMPCRTTWEPRLPTGWRLPFGGSF